jgi:hypothetical protein
MMRHEKSNYDGLIRAEITNHLIRDFALGQIEFSWVYSVSPITVIDEITEKYLQALEASGKFDGWERPFDFLRGEIRFKYGTTYMANIIYHVAEFFEFMYTRCIRCDERTPCQYCDMEPKDIRKCIERENVRFWANAAAPSWESD